MKNKNSNDVYEKCYYLKSCNLTLEEKFIIGLGVQKRELSLAHLAIVQEAYYREKSRAALIHRPKKYTSQEDKKVKLERYAEHHRKNPTKEEEILRPLLEGFGFLFQKPLLGYIPDFLHPKHFIIVEVDGGYHDTDSQKKYDKKKDKVFRARGYTVLRFKNQQVINNSPIIIGVLKEILQQKDIIDDSSLKISEAKKRISFLLQMNI